MGSLVVILRDSGYITYIGVQTLRITLENISCILIRSIVNWDFIYSAPEDQDERSWVAETRIELDTKRLRMKAERIIT